MDIKQATKLYESWLRERIPLLEPDLRLKHERMAQSAFSFLRATFYRWVQLWPAACPELINAPLVLGIGDLHVENFGTWRDCEGRLIWGVNDFDEAAQLPYTCELVRLAASASLAIRDNDLSCDPGDACEAVLAGYQEAYAEHGKPFVLAEHHRWLRDIALSNLRAPDVYWPKLNGLPTITRVPAQVMSALKLALPDPRLALRVVHRQAGLGSLGRRRFTVLTEWRGGCIAREAKELVDSAWHWEEERKARPILYERAIAQAVRVPDPFVSVKSQWLFRRLSHDCSRIELESLPGRRDELKLLHAMGWETANIHLGSKASVRHVAGDLKKRPHKWLAKAAATMVKATFNDWREWTKK